MEYYTFVCVCIVSAANLDQIHKLMPFQGPWVCDWGCVSKQFFHLLKCSALHLTPNLFCDIFKHGGRQLFNYIKRPDLNRRGSLCASNFSQGHIFSVQHQPTVLAKTLFLAPVTTAILAVACFNPLSLNTHDAPFQSVLPSPKLLRFKWLSRMIFPHNSACITAQQWVATFKTISH